MCSGLSWFQIASKRPRCLRPHVAEVGHAIGTAYPYDWLWYLGQEVAGRLQADRGSQAKVIELEEEWTDFTGERPVQPALSRILIDKSEEGTLFRVPRLGWSNLGPIVLLFAGGAIAAVVLCLFISIPGKHWLILLGFLPAIGLLLGRILLARRQVSIEVRSGTLVLTRIGLFRHIQSWSVTH